MNVMDLIALETRQMTLDRLRQKYEFQPITPQLANRAIADRLAIIRDCDIKGFETEEESLMMEYLWNVRQMVVNHIIAAEVERESKLRADAIRHGY